jgi:uncharacterized OB-fold protein
MLRRRAHPATLASLQTSKPPNLQHEAKRDMSPRVARCPTLYTVPDDPATSTKLRGGRCSSGHVFFPPQRLGCTTCGAHGESIEIVELEATGILRSHAFSHREKRPGSDQPLIIGTVVLDAGPAIEVVLAVDDLSGLESGQRVNGRLVEVAEAGEEGEAGEGGEAGIIVDCFFAPAGSSPGAL